MTILVEASDKESEGVRLSRLNGHITTIGVSSACCLASSNRTPNTNPLLCRKPSQTTSVQEATCKLNDFIPNQGFDLHHTLYIVTLLIHNPVGFSYISSRSFFLCARCSLNPTSCSSCIISASSPSSPLIVLFTSSLVLRSNAMLLGWTPPFNWLISLLTFRFRRANSSIRASSDEILSGASISGGH